MQKFMLGALMLLLGSAHTPPAEAQCSLDSSTCFEVKPAVAPCGMQSKFWSHFATMVEGDFEVTLGIDKERGAPGETFEFYLYIENLTDTTQCVNWLLQPMCTIFVIPAACGGDAQSCLGEAVFSYPSGYFGPSGGLEIQPGECRSWHYGWDTASSGVEPGDYYVLAGLFDPMCGAGGEFLLPEAGLRLPIAISAETSGAMTSLSLLKARF
jgi:hypothetical protein